MSGDADVELLAEGTGPRVKTRTITEPYGPDASGNAQADRVRHLQVISRADKRGDIDADDRTNEVIERLAAIHETLLLILAELN